MVVRFSFCHPTRLGNFLGEFGDLILGLPGFYL